MFATCAICGVHYGTGRHFKDLTEGDIHKALRVGHPFSAFLDDLNTDVFLSIGGFATSLIV